jgi:uncharacterized protein (TIGR03382 family)
MFGTLKVLLFVLAATGIASVGYVFYSASVSPLQWVYQGGSPTNWQGGVHGAPGPIVGAGLPVAIAYGVYWLMRRRRKVD